MAIICGTTDKFYKFMNINVIPIIPFWYVAVNALICFTHSKPKVSHGDKINKLHHYGENKIQESKSKCKPYRVTLTG